MFNLTHNLEAKDQLSMVSVVERHERGKWGNTGLVCRLFTLQKEGCGLEEVSSLSGRSLCVEPEALSFLMDLVSVMKLYS